MLQPLRYCYAVRRIGQIQQRAIDIKQNRACSNIERLDNHHPMPDVFIQGSITNGNGDWFPGVGRQTPEFHDRDTPTHWNQIGSESSFLFGHKP